jgi:Fe-S-cluster containining protein
LTVRFNYPKHVGFICNNCGRCCGDTKDKVRHILLLKTDVDRITNKTLLEAPEFIEEVFGFEPYIFQIRKSENGRCFFLKKNRCTIYKIRPLICRFYPFQLKNIGKNRFSFSYTNKCTGIEEGSQKARVYFKSLFNKFTNAMEKNKSNCID